MLQKKLNHERTFSEAKLIQRSRQNMRALIPFVGILLVLPEILPVVIVTLPSLIPRPFITPQAQEKALRAQTILKSKALLEFVQSSIQHPSATSTDATTTHRVELEAWVQVAQKVSSLCTTNMRIFRHLFWFVCLRSSIVCIHTVHT